jgi:hypothetical protein
VSRSAEEFQQAAIERGLTRWTIHECSICGYPCAYIFNWADTEVAYDSSCYCTRYHNPPRPGTWQDVADHYNMQSSPAIITKYDEFWGFRGREDNLG